MPVYNIHVLQIILEPSWEPKKRKWSGWQRSVRKQVPVNYLSSALIECLAIVLRLAAASPRKRVYYIRFAANYCQTKRFIIACYYRRLSMCVSLRFANFNAVTIITTMMASSSLSSSSFVGSSSYLQAPKATYTGQPAPCRPSAFFRIFNMRCFAHKHGIVCDFPKSRSARENMASSRSGVLLWSAASRDCMDSQSVSHHQASERGDSDQPNHPYCGWDLTARQVISFPTHKLSIVHGIAAAEARFCNRTETDDNVKLIGPDLTLIKSSYFSFGRLLTLIKSRSILGLVLLLFVL